MKVLRIVFAGVLAALLFGCEGLKHEAKGQAEVGLALRFAADARPVPKEEDLRLRVRIEWEGGKAENDGEFKPGATVKVTSIPNGSGRKAIAEVYRADARIIYHGESDPFIVEPGMRVTVEVELVSSPEAGVEADKAVRVKDANAARFAQGPMVTLVFEALNGTKV